MSTNEANELLKAFEKVVEGKTIEEIHEIIQEAIERIKKNNPGIDMEKITEIFYLIERHLVERLERKRSR
ncbi:MAG: hypothetical protein E6590_12860 [Clostridiales bacterium]|uniref:hypothetical protein n=1 Tax=Clostridium sp. TaxID=1506 RepID=UPI00290C1CD6|nr:hypothetical protein [Clostridium sp.]MDU6274041.1 hypothetical protein [Clostridium sp.]MDU6360842.1 hypothetical protein [Clostridiales bacterium]